MSKKVQEEDIITIINKPREIFINELKKQVVEGLDLGKKEVINPKELEIFYSYFTDWDDYNIELIKRSFRPQNSEYYNEYSRLNDNIGLLDVMYRRNTESFEYKRKEAGDKLNNCVTWLTRLLSKINLIEDFTSIKNSSREMQIYNQGFIIHGHDSARKFEVARFIENDLQRKAIILHEQASGGKSLIEKFERNSNVDFAVAIWTADDLGKAKNDTDLMPRTRQNVIFETGFFIGKLGRENVIVLYEEGVDIPTDYKGVVYTSFSGNWKDDLRKEIAEIYNQLQRNTSQQ